MADQRFKTGEALPPQRELAQRLGVSRATLREAVSVLATIGMLSVEQGRGTFVLTPGAEPQAQGLPTSWRFAARYSPEEVYQFRYIAESHAAQLAAMTHTADEIAAMNTSVRDMKGAIKTGDLEMYAQSDFAFHALVMRLSHNRLLADMHRGFSSVLIESQRLPLIDRSRLWEPVIEHERIVEAVTPIRSGGRTLLHAPASQPRLQPGRIRLVEVD